MDMNNQERALRVTLNNKGYTLGKRGGGYRIGDKVTDTVYLGKDYDATWNEVTRFADNMDESGYSDLAPFKDDDGNSPEDYAVGYDMELTNLIRHKETLILQGKHAQAEELDEKIKELEEVVKDHEDDQKLENRLRAFLDEHGYRLERGYDGYGISEKATGAVCFAKRYDATLDEAAEFAEKMGMALNT